MSAIDTFRRAMRRHEKRARRMGLRGFATVFRNYRIDAEILGPSMVDHVRCIADGYRRDTRIEDPYRRRGAFLYSLAAAAVARLRVGLAEEATHVEGMTYASPHQPGSGLLRSRRLLGCA